MSGDDKPESAGTPATRAETPGTPTTRAETPGTRTTSAGPAVRAPQSDPWWQRTDLTGYFGFGLLLLSLGIVWQPDIGAVVEALGSGRTILASCLAVMGLALLLLGVLKANGAALLKWGAIFTLYVVAAYITIGPKVIPPKLFGLISVGFALVIAAQLLGHDMKKETLQGYSRFPGSIVIMLWTLLIVFALASISAAAVTGNKSDVVCAAANEASSCVAEGAWSDYLILLGVPGAAAVLNKNASVKSSDEGTSADDSSPTPDQISDLQYLVFNLIAMVFVGAGIVQDLHLGEVPDVLLGLTSASALTFYLAKQ